MSINPSQESVTAEAVETPQTVNLGPATLQMIQPPGRGDQAAVWWLAAGVLVYIGLAIVFLIGLVDSDEGWTRSLLELIGLGEPANPAIFVLVVGGFALTAIAMISVARDIWTIRSEEEDVEWLQLHGREGAPLVLAPAAEREALFQAGRRSIPSGDTARVETLVDDRVRRAHAVRMSSGSASIAVEELRIIAERRTARLGGFARYASSLLLLIAVLGTFAGVKTALPGLIEAVAAADAVGGDAPRVGSSIQAPLRAVADAFGANALALIGAIAVGLMAHGLTIGRRHLLERLELVSAEYIYGEDEGQSADPLRAAVQALQRTAQEIHQSSGAFLGIESGLEVLGSDFKSSFNSLDDRLLQVLQQQESGLYDRTARALEELQLRISSLAEIVEANSRTYAGLVDRIGDRTEESRQAVGQMRASNEQLTKALEGMVRLGEASTRASEQVEEASKQLVDGTIQVAQQTEALTRSMEEVRPVLSHVEKSLEASASRLEAVDARAARTWADAGEQMRQTMDRISTQLSQAIAAGSGVRDVESAFRRTTVQDGPGGTSGPSAWKLVLLPLVGTLGGAAALYLLARLGVLSLLP